MGAIIAAILGGVITLWATSEQNKAVESTNKKAEGYYNLERQDALKTTEENKRLSKERLRLEKLGLQFQRDADLYGRKEREYERGKGARENKFAQTLSFINYNDQIRNNYVNMWKGGK